MVAGTGPALETAVTGRALERAGPLRSERDRERETHTHEREIHMEAEAAQPACAHAHASATYAWDETTRTDETTHAHR